MVIQRLKTRTIIRCCWVMWTTGAFYAWTTWAAVIHASGREWWQAAAYATLGGFLSVVLINETRSAFSDLCSHIKTASVDRFIAEGK